MTAVLTLLSTLRERGIKIWSEGEHLRVRATEEALTPQLREQLTQYKSDILDLLRQATLDIPLSLPKLFEHQVKTTPDAIACLSTNDSGENTGALTYTELNTKANRL